MATKEKSESKTKKKPAPKAGKKRGPTLDQAITALPDGYRGTRPAVPIAVLVQEAKDLARAAQPVLAKLGRLGLDTALVTTLRERADALEEAEATWRVERKRAFGKAGAALQAEGIEVRTEIVAAGRFFLRGDAKVQSVLDAIVEGSGVEDLIEDLGACARFVAEHEAALEAAEVEGGIVAAAERAKAIADELSGAVSDQRVDTRAGEARARRDDVAAVVSYALDEIRAAARYLYRHDPQKLAAFRSAYHVARGRRRPKKTPKKPTPASE